MIPKTQIQHMKYGINADFLSILDVFENYDNRTNYSGAFHTFDRERDKHDILDLHDLALEIERMIKHET